MNKIKGYWIDENGNGWNANIYTEEQAMQYSDTLVNCRDCQDCHDCDDCQDCHDCRDCHDCCLCHNCHDCRRCRNCHNCKYCHDCRRCEYCDYCRRCEYCDYCRRCYDCRRCQNCDDCRNCDDCDDCQNCHNCRYCQSCEYCYNCQDIHDYAKTPQRYTTPKIGSRNDNTTIYWTNKDDIQVVCGCFRGDLEDWEEAINETHKDNEKHRNDYLKQLEIIKTLVNFNASK